MKIRIVIFSLMIVMISGVVNGCDKEKIILEDTYIEEQDFPYTYYDSHRYGVNTIETQDGYYKLSNSMIYYTEKKSMSVIPLCNKPNCLHDKEAGEKRTECNAYTDSKDGFLGYYANHLYVLSEEWDSDDRTTYYGIYQITMDGISQKKRYTLKGNTSIHQWIVHRGYLYYNATQTDDDEKGHQAIWRISLKKFSSPEPVYHMTDIYSGDIEYLGAYGNYVYFVNLGFNIDINSDLTDNYVQTMENRWYCYNIVTGEVEELFQEQKENGTMVKLVQNITFWQDKIIFDYFYLNTEKQNATESKEIWQCDLNGENYQKVLTKGDTFDKTCSDGTYLYVYNFWRKSIDSGEEKPKVAVYDKNLNLVDELEMKVSYTADLIPGNARYFFFDVAWEDTLQMFYVDKNNIGTHKGSADIILYYESEGSGEEGDSGKGD